MIYNRNRYILIFFFLMIRRPPRSTLDRSSAASDVYKRQVACGSASGTSKNKAQTLVDVLQLSLIHISEPTRQAEISYAVFCLKKKTINRACSQPNWLPVETAATPATAALHM